MSAAERQRVLLIVEDAEDISETHKIWCRLALDELTPEGFDTQKYRIHQAYEYEEARALVRSGQVDFVSVDIALDEPEYDLSDEVRGREEPGGMALLADLQELEVGERPLIVVVSGEGLHYGIEAAFQYGVLDFQEKSKFDGIKYKQTVKAALWYQHAARLLQRLDTISATEIAIAHARELYDKAVLIAHQAGIQKDLPFPEDLGLRIESQTAKLLNPDTGLPNFNWTRQQLKRMVVGKREWSMIFVTILGYHDFSHTHGFQAKESLPQYVGMLVRQTRDAFEENDLFIGHVEGNVTEEPGFVVVWPPEKSQLVTRADMEAWTKRMGNMFRQNVHRFKDQFKTQPSEVSPSLIFRVLQNEEYIPDLNYLLDEYLS